MEDVVPIAKMFAYLNRVRSFLFVVVFMLCEKGLPTFLLTEFSREDILIGKNFMIYVKRFFFSVLSNVAVVILSWHERRQNVLHGSCSLNFRNI